MTTRTVTGKWVKPDRTPASGKVRFLQVERVIVAGQYVVLPGPPIDATLNNQGAISVSLPITGEGEPEGWLWQVIEDIGYGSSRYYIEVPASASPLDLTTVVPVDVADGGPAYSAFTPQSRTLTAGTGLTGGGSLAADRTIGIAAGGVGTSQLADASVTGPKIAADSIDSSHIAPGVVIESDVADGAITNAKVAANAAISPSKIDGTAVVDSDNRLVNSRTPTAHKTSHATGGTDALSPSDIGAATSAQGAKADTAVQPASLSTVATTGAYSDLSGKPTLGTAAGKDIPATGNASATQVVYGSDTRLSDTRTPADASVTDAKISGTLSPSKITGTAVVTSDSRLSDQRVPTSHASTHATGGADALTPANIVALTSAAVSRKPITSNYVNPSGGYTTFGSWTGNVPLAVPIHLWAGTLDRIGCECVTTAGSTGSVVRLGIYSDTNGWPDARVLDAGTVDTTTTGVKEITISQAVNTAQYWLVAVFQGGPTTQPTMRAMQNAGQMQFSNTGANVSAMNFGGATTTGALASSWGTPNVGMAQTPRIFVRYGSVT